MRLKNLIFVGLLVILLVPGSLTQASADERANRLIAKLESGKTVFGVLGGAMAAPRIAKVLGTSDLDFILADLEHEVLDFGALRHFVLGVNDFNQRFRGEASEAPADERLFYLIKKALGSREKIGCLEPYRPSYSDGELAIYYR